MTDLDEAAAVKIAALEWARRQIYALNEDTLERMDKDRAAGSDFARGSIAEAKAIARAMGIVIDLEIAAARDGAPVAAPQPFSAPSLDDPGSVVPRSLLRAFGEIDAQMAILLWDISTGSLKDTRKAA